MKHLKLFENFEINEGKLPSNITDWLKNQGSAQKSAANKIAGWVEKAGNRISGGTSIGKSPQTLVLDIKHQGSEIYINADGEINFLDEPVTSPKEFQKLLDVYKRSSDENKKYFKITDEVAS